MFVCWFRFRINLFLVISLRTALFKLPYIIQINATITRGGPFFPYDFFLTSLISGTIRVSLTTTLSRNSVRDDRVVYVDYEHAID